MVKLDSSTINQLVEILRPFMEDERNRRPFLVLALGNDAPVLQHIIWSGAVASFISDMVCKLADYGEAAPGKQALWMLLEYVRSQVGEDVQLRISELVSKLQVPNIKSTPIHPLSSSAEEKYREEVKRLVSDIKISDTSRRILNEFKQKFSVSQQTAEKVETEVLQTFYEYQKRLDEFLQVLVDQIAHKLPFSVKTQSELREIENNWNLKNKDIEKLYIGLANELYKQNRLEESIYIYKEALAVNPNNAITRENLAYILLQCGQIDDANTEYREAIRIEPNNVKLHIDLGKTFYVKGQFEKAIEVYQQAIKLNTDDTPDDLAEIHYLLGCTFCEFERLENAIQEYTQAIKMKPLYAEAYAKLGDCQYRLKNFVDAANNLQQAIRLKPDNPAFHFYLGIIISSQGKYRDAIVKFEKAIELNIIDSTPDPIVYTHYAFALLGQNKQKKAKAEIEIAIKLFQKQKMGDAAKQMEHLFEQIKKEGSWKSFFQNFRKI